MEKYANSFFARVGVGVCNIQFRIYTRFTDFSNGVDFSIFVFQLFYYIQNSDLLFSNSVFWLLLFIYSALPTFLYRMTLIFIGSLYPFKNLILILISVSLLVFFLHFSNDFYTNWTWVKVVQDYIFFLKAWL